MANDLVPADAEQPNVLHGLIRKRGELAGRVEQRQLELRHAMAELEHVDAVIRIFNPAVDIGAIRVKRPTPQHAALRGEVTKVVLDTLRDATEPVTSREITLRLMQQRGLDTEDRGLKEVMIKRVRACLRAHRSNGLIRVALSAANLQAWEVVR